MASEKISSGVNLTSQFFLQNFYRYNRSAMKSSNRSDFTVSELSFEDSRALKRAAAKLSSFDYTNTDNGDNLINTIKAFTETYNHTIDSTSSPDSDTYRQNRQLQALTKRYGSELKDIGITIEEDGKLSIAENTLKGSTWKELRKVFSEESDYVKNIRTIAKRLHNTSYDEVYAEMTGSGGKINIVL